MQGPDEEADGREHTEERVLLKNVFLKEELGLVSLERGSVSFIRYFEGPSRYWKIKWKESARTPRF